MRGQPPSTGAGVLLAAAVGGAGFVAGGVVADGVAGFGGGWAWRIAEAASRADGSRIKPSVRRTVAAFNVVLVIFIALNPFKNRP